MLLTRQVKKVHWDAAGVTLWLAPLTADFDQRFVDECLFYQSRPDGTQVQMQDAYKYACLVGQHCINRWVGVQAEDDDGQLNDVECTPGNIDQFMQIEPAQNFVFSQAKGLGVWLQSEIDAAKKD